jgi:hypothetical protein
MLSDFLIQARKFNVTAVTTTYWQMGTAQFCEAAQRLAGNDEIPAIMQCHIRCVRNPDAHWLYLQPSLQEVKSLSIGYIICICKTVYMTDMYKMTAINRTDNYVAILRFPVE